VWNNGVILGSCKEVVERRQACLTTAHASKKILHLQSAAQPSLPIQGGTSSGSFQAEYIQQRGSIFVKESFKTHKKYRNFS
jgi:hypothetical protein